MKAQLHLADLALPASQLVADPIELMAYEVDGGMDRGQPDAVVFPQTAAEVARVVGWAAARGVPIVARGAGTGLSGGAVAERGGIILQCSRMAALRRLSAAGRSASVEPGLVNQQLDLLARAQGLYYPPDPSSGRSATIGGNIAENSGGPHCFKYGVTTNYVSGMEVVLADGQIVRLGGRALDYPEYDLTGLVCGSEGTLAVVTAAELRLIGVPPAVKTLMAAFPSVEAAGEAVSALIAGGLVPATLEMMDQQMMRIIEQFTGAGLPVDAGAALIVEADGFERSVGPQIEEIAAILSRHGAGELRIARSAEERDLIWYGRKSAVGAMTRLAPAYYLVDVTVPRSKLAATLAGVNRICTSHALRVGYVFHAGDGNLHPLILIDNPRDAELMERVHAAGREIVALCVGFDGSITGEHGVGIEKRAYMPLMYTPAELEAMRAIKVAFDPMQTLNPGKIFPEPAAGPVPPDEPELLPALPAGPATLEPVSAAEAAGLLRAATAAGRPVALCGAGSQGALPGPDLTLSTARLRGLHTLALDDLYVTVGAGTPLDEIQAALAPARMWVPAVASGPASTVGGLVSTNTNAPLRMRYGGWRDLLLAATVALSDGRLIRAGRPVVKNVAGYDLPKLFVGARGTLGLLADVTLKLAPLPRARASLVIPVESIAQGLALGARLLPGCLTASALLLLGAAELPGVALGAPFALVYTAEGLEHDVAAELEQAQRIAGGAAQVVAGLAGSALWAAWLARTRAADERPTLRLGLDPEDLAGAAAELAPQALAAGGSFLADLANGQLYLHGAPDLAAAQRQARASGGYGLVLSGPAADRWGHRPEGLELMRRIKAAYDPGAILNRDAFLL